MKMLWIIGKFTFLTILIMKAVKFAIGDYEDHFPGLDSVLPILALGLSFFVNEAAKSRRVVFMKKKMSKKIKVTLLVLLAFFLSKRLRTRLYNVIEEVKSLFSNKSYKQTK